MTVPGSVVRPCDRCGADAPYDFADVWLCLDCYHVAGSTCAGIGRPWPASDQQPTDGPHPVC